MDWKTGYAKLVAPSVWLDQLRTKPALSEQICTSCGHLGAPVRRKHGADDIELWLWLLVAACLVLYVMLLAFHALCLRVLHHTFPGPFVSLFSFLTKLSLLLGAVYTIWRASTEYLACPKCEHETMIPLDTPQGRKVRAENQPPKPAS